MENSSKISVSRVLKIVGNTIFYLIIVLLLVFSIANIRVKQENDLPHIFGVGFLTVLTDSMEGEEVNSFSRGDLLFVRMLNDQGRSDLKVGDVITYYDLSIPGFNTHRIVEVGSTYLITQGDKIAMNPARKYDPNSNENDPNTYEIMSKDEAIAIYSSTWSGAGETLSRVQQPSGFLVFIVLPVALILILQGVFLVRNILKYSGAKLEVKHEQEKEEVKKELEAEKEKIRAQLLEEMKKEQEENNKKQEKE